MKRILMSSLAARRCLMISTIRWKTLWAHSSFSCPARSRAAPAYLSPGPPRRPLHFTWMPRLAGPAPLHQALPRLRLPSTFRWLNVDSLVAGYTSSFSSPNIRSAYPRPFYSYCSIITKMCLPHTLANSVRAQYLNYKI